MEPRDPISNQDIAEIIALLDMLARIYRLMEVQRELQKLSEQEFLDRDEDEELDQE